MSTLTMASITQYKQIERLMIAVDCIIFGFDGERLKALFVKRNFEPEKGRWSLMGGFVKKDESVNDAAGRILEQLTGLHNIYMEQLSCFGEVNRDPGGRVVSVAYYALINISDYPKELMEEHHTKWFSIDAIPALVFDHREMVNMAKQKLQEKCSNHPVGFVLLPDKFTLQKLQNLYEAIFESKFDKRNFIKKILSLNILRKLAEKDKLSSKKGSFYYVFDEQNYNKLAKEGVKFV
jgi:8-oxo-dGTP diphosphatase